MTILFISIEFNYCCGISRSIYALSMKLKEQGHRILLGAPGGTMVKDFVDHGLEYFYLPVNPGHKNIKDGLSCILAIRKKWKTEEIDIIHAHHRLAEFYSLAASTFGGPPVVSTAHAIVTGKKGLSFRSKKVIAVSQVVKEMLVEKFGIDESKLAVIRNIPRQLTKPSGEAIESFKTRIEFKETDFIVAGIGRLHVEKGFDVLLEAIHQLRTIEDIKVVIVGKGDEKARLQQYAAEHGLKAYIVEEMQDIEIIYTIADIVVIPSRQETVGLVAIEAAFFKKPVVASNVGGLKETIMDQVTGLAVEPEDPLAISAAIRLLYSKRDLASKLGCRLFEEVQSVYESNKIVGEMERIYSLSSV